MSNFKFTSIICCKCKKEKATIREHKVGNDDNIANFMSL